MSNNHYVHIDYTIRYEPYALLGAIIPWMPPKEKLDLKAIAIVSEAGREYYALNKDRQAYSYLPKNYYSMKVHNKTLKEIQESLQAFVEHPEEEPTFYIWPNGNKKEILTLIGQLVNERTGILKYADLQKMWIQCPAWHVLKVFQLEDSGLVKARDYRRIHQEILNANVSN